MAAQLSSSQQRKDWIGQILGIKMKKLDCLLEQWVVLANLLD